MDERQELADLKLKMKLALEASRRVVHLMTTKKYMNLHKLWQCYEKHKEKQEWELMVKDYREKTGDLDIGSQDIYILIEWMVNTKDRWQNI